MSERDRDIQRDWRIRPRDAGNVSGYIAGSDVFRLAVTELARVAPAVALRKVAAALKPQPRGGKISAVLQFIRCLAEAEPGIAADVLHALGEEA